MKRRRAAAGLLAAASALLAGCASLGRPASGGAADTLAGRLAVQVQGDAARSFSADFELQGDARRGSLALTTALGIQVAQADWTAEQVRLRSRDGVQIYADLDSLAEGVLGERVPLAALFDWLRGRPWPGAASRGDDQGFLQLGWQVDVSRRDEGVIQARRAAAPAVTLRAKLDAP